MKRVNRNKTRRIKTKIENMAIILGTLFIIATAFSYAYFMDKENDRIMNFIKDYDKERKVYYLQKDLFGGDF